MKLGMGTVQFGMAYGLAGTTGHLAESEVRRILAYAAQRGVVLLDTAPSYGESEAFLGRALWPGHPMQIITKTPTFRRAVTAADGQRVIDACKRSLERLGVARIYGLLVHDANHLLGEGGEQIQGALEAIKANGGCSKIGASVYDGAQIDALLDRFSLDLIQLPLSLLDQRLLASGHLERLKKRNIEIHVRSVFLQGLLLMDPSSLPLYFEPIRPRLIEYNTYLRDQKRSRLDAAIGFVKRIEEVDAIICGVESREQLEEIVRSFAAPSAKDDYSRFRLEDPLFVDPRRWPPDR